MAHLFQDPARVLIVEDEVIIIKSLENRLKNAGYQIIATASSGPEAIEKATTLNPDLILMDIKLDGEMNGIQAAEEIHKYLDIPIIYLTSFNDESTFQKAKITNPFGYLLKPFDGEQLSRFIELTLVNHRINHQLNETKKRYEIALEASNTAVWEILISQDKIIYDKNLRNLFGYDEDELSNDFNDWNRLIHPEDIKFVTEEFEKVYSGQLPIHKMEYRIIRKNGTVGWVTTHLNIINSETGIPVRVIGGTTDITERKLSEQALKKSEEKFRSTFESAGIGVAIMGPDMRFTKVNQSLSEMIGYTQFDFLKLTLCDITFSDDKDQTNKIIKGILKGNFPSPHQWESRLKRRTNQLLWTSSSISLVKDFKGKPLYFIILITDISKRINAEEQLKNSNLAKDKFFSIISHDLRNPFHTILGASEYLSVYNHELNEKEVKEVAHNIHSSAKNVFNLLVNLLEWSRVHTDRLEVNKVEIELNGLVDEVLNLFKDSLEQKGILLINELSGNIRLLADRYMIDTVIRNIISNAIKYSTNGGRITIGCNEIGDFVKIFITDTGVGISKDNQKKLFRIDQQFSVKGTANETGTGLGLVLCKEFVEKNGGNITVESSPTKGSTFAFTVPVKH